MENKEYLLDLSGVLYVIKNDISSVIPSVELDKKTGFHNILVFTSIDNAKKYCYLRRPNSNGNIVKLSKKVYCGELIQSGLLYIAFEARRNYPNIKYFVFDHPGTRGDAHYATVRDVINYMKSKENNKISNKNELKEFLEEQE